MAEVQHASGQFGAVGFSGVIADEIPSTFQLPEIHQKWGSLNDDSPVFSISVDLPILRIFIVAHQIM